MSIVASGAALLLAGSGFLTYDLITFRAAMLQRLSTQADIAGYNTVSAILFRDDQAAANTLAALRADGHITSAAVYDADGKLFATYSRPDPKSEFEGRRTLSSKPSNFETEGLSVFRSIEFQGKPIGTAYIRSDMKEWTDRLQRYLGIGIVVLVLSTMLALGISSALQKGLTGPISRLAEAARIVSQRRNYSIRVAVESRDELGQLAETFNEMLEQVQGRDAVLQKARDEVEQQVVERTMEWERANAELEATNKELEAFSYSISHDLRAPLRHIDGFSRILEEECAAQLDPSARRYLQRIRDGTRRMGALVDDLLSLSRLGRQDVRRQMTGLRPLVEEVRAELREMAEQRGIQRNIEWRIGELPFADCDPILMKQVFANLMSNAVKYTRPSERAVIEVAAMESNGETVVFVRDNGVGFSMKYADKLFGVFQRLHRQEDFEGTGVGLATVQRIIQKHGGRIWVEAELDKGACFYFTLGSRSIAEEASQEVAAVGGQV